MKYLKHLLVLLPLLLLLLIPTATSFASGPSEDSQEALAKQAGFAPASVRDTMTAIALASGGFSLAQFEAAFKATDDGEHFNVLPHFSNGDFLQSINEGGTLIHGCASLVKQGYELYKVTHLIDDKDGDKNHLIPILWKSFAVKVAYPRHHQKNLFDRVFCTG